MSAPAFVLGLFVGVVVGANLAIIAICVLVYRHEHKVAESESELLFVPVEWVRS